MTAARAFFNDIVRHPDDDTPRLIFADWLEDQGDENSLARSDFIRIQCRLAQPGGARAERAALAVRQDELLTRYGRCWAGRIDRYVDHRAFHRGFVDTIAINADDFLHHVRGLFRLAPLQHVRLTWESSEVRMTPELAECSYLRRLLSLDLHGTFLDSTALQALAASPHLARLQRLDLSWNRIGGGGVRSLIQAPLFGRLTALDLQHNHLEGSSARLLGQALLELAERGRAAMQCLDLRNNAISWMARRALTSSPLLRKVVRLD